MRPALSPPRGVMALGEEELSAATSVSAAEPAETDKTDEAAVDGLARKEEAAARRGCN